jgi:carbonic anhydrase/acetyltransferase-like protein (isoleucine patch superfamily)
MPVYALGDAVPRIHETAYVHPDAVVIGKVQIDAEASIWPGAGLRGDYRLIRIGARTSIQDGTVLHTTDKSPTVIGADCVVGHNAHLEGCTVEDGSLIGSGSVTLAGARVGAGSVVGAGAVVPEGCLVPAEAMALGVPARIHKGQRGTGGSRTVCASTSRTPAGTARHCGASTEGLATAGPSVGRFRVTLPRPRTP